MPGFNEYFWLRNREIWKIFGPFLKFITLQKFVNGVNLQNPFERMLNYNLQASEPAIITIRYFLNFYSFLNITEQYSLTKMMQNQLLKKFFLNYLMEYLNGIRF